MLSTPTTAPTWSRLQTCEAGDFVAALAGIAEHAPWVAQAVAGQRPFRGLEALHGAMVAAVRQAPAERLIALLNGHPELAGREAIAGEMTPESSGEQGRLGLTALDAGRLDRLNRLNAAYKARFGFPYIVALRRHASLDSVFADLDLRLQRDTPAEIEAALAQVADIMRGRLERLLAPTESLSSTRSSP